MYQFFPDRKEEQKIPQYYLKTDSVALICDTTMIMFNPDYELLSGHNIVEVALPLSTDSTAILNVLLEKINENTNLSTIYLLNHLGHPLDHTPAPNNLQVTDILSLFKSKDSVKNVELKCFDLTDANTKTSINEFLQKFPNLEQVELCLCNKDEIFDNILAEILDAARQRQIATPRAT